MSCEHPELADLPAQLLGRTLIVRDLAPPAPLPPARAGLSPGDAARRIARTRWHADRRHASRRDRHPVAQKRIARVRANSWSSSIGRIGETEHDWQTLRDQIDDLETALVHEQEEEITVLGEQAADLRGRVQRPSGSPPGLARGSRPSAAMKSSASSKTCKRSKQTWRQSEAQAAEAETLVQTLHARLHAGRSGNPPAAKPERQSAQQAFTQAQVTFAQVEERLRGLQTQYQQAARDYQQRAAGTGAESAERRQPRKRACSKASATMLNASASLAQAYLDKENAQRTIAALIEDRDRKRTERGRLTQQAQDARNEWRTHQENVHQRELEATQSSPSTRLARAASARRLPDRTRRFV